MDIKDLKGLMEAYTEVYAPQEEIEEAVKGESSERRKALAAERRSGIKPLSTKEGEKYASHKISQMAHTKRAKMGEEVEQVDELYKGKHGQTEKEYQDSRSHGGKMISGDSKSSGAAWSHRSYRGVGKPAKPGERQANQGKMDRGTRADIEYRKANLKKEELDIFDVVLEFLQAEGYAETLEEAEWMMANELDSEDIANILEVLDTPEKANEYAKKNVKSMLGAFAKGVVNKDMSQMKTIKKRTEGAKMAKRKAERKAAEEN